MYNLVLNADHKLVKQVLTDADNSCKAALEPIESEMANLNNRRKELQKAQEGKKTEDIPQAEKDELNDIEKKISDETTKKQAVLGEYANGNKIIHQINRSCIITKQYVKKEKL